MHLHEAPRAGLFRLLGDEDRLRLLALCADEELAVSELAVLLHESQPQITRKTQPLRDAGLLLARKDGTRTLLKAAPVDDAVVAVALQEGQRLCAKEGSLARIPAVIRAREEGSRHFFESGEQPAAAQVVHDDAALAFLPLVRALLPRADLCVDVGAGDGTLLPLLSPLFARVFAVDRSAGRLARCASLIASRGLPNVRLLQGEADDGHVLEAIARHGGADVVVLARTLHHAARPAALVASCARLLTPGGALLVVDYLPHADEALREQQGDVWLGFAPDKLAGFARDAGLVSSTSLPMPALPGAPDAHVPWQLFVARKGASPSSSSPHDLQ